MKGLRGFGITRTFIVAICIVIFLTSCVPNLQEYDDKKRTEETEDAIINDHLTEDREEHVPSSQATGSQSNPPQRYEEKITALLYSLNNEWINMDGSMQPTIPNKNLKELMNGVECNYQFETIYPIEGNDTIKYPQFLWVKNNEITEKINETMRNTVSSLIESNMLFDLDYSIAFSNDKILSVLFQVSTKHPTLERHYFNFDLLTGDNLTIQNFFLMDRAFWATVLKDENIVQRSNIPDEEYTQIFERVLEMEEVAFNKTIKGTPSEYFTADLYRDSNGYFDEKNVYVDIAIPHVIGDYVTFAIPIKELLNISDAYIQ